MNRRSPEGSDGSDHGTTSTGSSEEHSADQSENITNYLSVTEVGSQAQDSGVCEKEAEKSVLGPIAIVAAVGTGLGEEGAVAAMGGCDQADIGVSLELAATLVGDADEGIVERVEDKRRHRDSIDHTSSSGPIVIIFRSGKAGVECGDSVIKFAQGTNPGCNVLVEDARKQHNLAAIATQQSAKKFHLVKAVLWAMQCVGRGAKIERGRYPDHRTKFWWHRCAEFAGKFEDEISSHRIANQRHRLQSLLRDEEVHHG